MSLILPVWTIAAMLLAPLLAYRQYRHGRWSQLALGALAFLWLQDQMMLLDKGSVAQTFGGTAVLFLLLYAPLASLLEVNRFLVAAVAGGIDGDITDEDAADAFVRACEWLALAVLVLCAHLLVFVALTALELLSPAVLRAGEGILHCLFDLSLPPHAKLHRNTLNMLLAAVPVAMLMNMLNAWLRRRRRHHLSMPWQLYLAALPGVLCGGLFMASRLSP